MSDKASKNRMMQTAATAQYQYGTLHEFQTARRIEEMNHEQFEAYAQELQAMIVQLVTDPDSGFNIHAQLTLPRLKTLGLNEILIWMLGIEEWFKNLRVREQQIFCAAKFTWV